MSDFWDRRKQAVAAEEQAHRAALQALEANAAEKALAERSDADLLADAGQPEPEELDSPEDVRDFLQSALPQRLKTRALRRLWRLNPTLANLDGLVDYGEDFTDAATVMENIQTAYQVGKGMLSHIEAVAVEADTSQEPAEQEQVAEDDTPVDAPPADEMPQVQIATAPLPEPQEPREVPVGMPTRRRMAFTFDETAAP